MEALKYINDWRFIPAGAGNTCTGHTEFLCDSVYPRWRGEHIDLCFDDFTGNGLAPLARGTLVTNYPVDTHLRFIPAGAGNTLVAKGKPKKLAVYPRWRGEHI